MADNVAFTPGSGATAAADDIGGVMYARVKVGLGSDGTANDWEAGAGAADSGTARVILASDDPAVVALGGAGTSPPSLATGATGVIGWLRYLAGLASGYTAPVTLTRTADTNAYTANDVLGSATGSTAALTFADVGSSGGSIMVTRAELMISDTGLISGETSYTLHLYSVTPPSALGDNAAWDLPSGDRASYLGSIDLGTPSDVGSTLYADVTNLDKQMKLASTSLYGYLVTSTSYTPTSARVYKVTLHTVSL